MPLKLPPLPEKGPHQPEEETRGPSRFMHLPHPPLPEEGPPLPQEEEKEELRAEVFPGKFNAEKPKPTNLESVIHEEEKEMLPEPVVPEVEQAGLAVPPQPPAGASQLDSGVGAGFWLYEVCMYVYEKS